MIHLRRSPHLAADAFGLSALAAAALAGGPDFGPLPVPTRLTDVPRPTERLGAEERASLVDAIEAGRAAAQLDPDSGSAAGVRSSLDALRLENTFAIVTGQQPGFLASPLYSLYKALQACRAARELTEQWGAPVIPVFWNHADDHDVAEVHHAWLLNRNVDLQKVALPGLSSGRTPVGEIVLDAESQSLGALRAQLRGIVEEHAGADAAVDLFLPRSGETLARAFTRIFTRLAGKHGLVVVEPEWIRALLSSELGRLVSASSPPLVEALVAGEAELAALGLEAAIPVGDATDDADDAAALLYFHDRASTHADGAAERVALRAGGEGFRRDGEPGSRTHAEAGSSMVGAPTEWSAGALVRPLVQDAVFPTAAYIGGYGELAYHAQLGPARDAAGQPRTPFLPRVSATLVDDEVEYALERSNASVREVVAARGAFQHGPKDSGEPEVATKLRELAAETRERLLEHRAALAELEPALAITLKKTAGHVEQSIGKVIDKAKRVHDNSVGKGARQLRRINGALYPRGAPQERVLGPFQFFARYGEAFVDALAAELPGVSTEPLVLRIEDTESDQ